MAERRSHRDLRDFLRVLEERGELRRVRARVSPALEISEIANRVMKRPGGGPALLFEEVEDSDYPVLVNAFGSLRRMELALGVSRLDEVADRIRRLLRLPGPGSGWLERLGGGMRLLEAARTMMPRRVQRAPVQEVVEEEPDLTRLPILQCWPEDAGRFITLPLVITRDPETGALNLGMYRMQLFDGRTTGMHWQKQKVGQEHMEKARAAGVRRMEVAVALGGDPATIYSATAPLPPQLPELAFAGLLRGEPVEVVKALTVDLEVPAQAEFVLEGYVDLDELRVEGPFGDHTGFYSPAEPYPVFHVTAVTHRRDAIYPATVVGRPPMEDFFLGKATERIFLPFIQMVLPEVLDIHMPAEGVFHNCVLVRMQKRYAGHARKVAHGLWGLGLMSLAKCIVLVDEDCDVQDLSETVWRVFANIDPERDVFFVRGPADDLEHASPAWRYGSKMGVDATRKLPEEGHPRPWPRDVVMSPEIKALVDRRWREYGID
ncbi:MAG: menaquinone biosynthesis decarboxylase [Bacillota bacterium]|nr:menaquinone biosynthesis decarboxylase [Bacillota bacterium]